MRKRTFLAKETISFAKENLPLQKESQSAKNIKNEIFTREKMTNRARRARQKSLDTQPDDAAAAAGPPKPEWLDELRRGRAGRARAPGGSARGVGPSLVLTIFDSVSINIFTLQNV